MKYTGAFKLRKLVNLVIPILLPPDELMRYNTELYRYWVPAFSDYAYVCKGLNSWEESLIKRYCHSPGKVLDLLCGAGREAFALQKSGFEVTGLDNNPELLRQAQDYAQRLQAPVKFELQDILSLDFSGHKFDYILLLTHNYSSIAGKANRIKVLQRIKALMPPEGLFLATFKYRPETTASWFWIKKCLGLLCCGNKSLEPGDCIHSGMEFAHFFTGVAELQDEARAAGMALASFELESPAQRGHAVFKLQG